MRCSQLSVAYRHAGADLGSAAWRVYGGAGDTLVIQPLNGSGRVAPR